MRIAVLIIFFYIFGWRLVSQFDIIQAISAGFSAYAMLHWRHRIARASAPVLALFALTFVYSASVFVARGFTDLFPLLRIVRAVLTFVGGIGIAIFFERKFGNAAAQQLLRSTVLSVIAHGGIMVAMYIDQPFRRLIYSVTGGVEHANRGVFLGVNAADFGVRVMGLTYGLASTSVLQATSLFQLPNLFRGWRAPALLAPVLVLLILASAAVAGRSGLLLGGIMIPVFLALLLMMPGYRRLAALVLALSALTGALAFVLVVTLDGSRNQQIGYTLAHLEELNTIIVAPDRSATLKFLSGQLLLPGGAANLLFGVGSFGRSATFYLASDIGFVQQIFAYGVLGLVLLWAPLICMLGIAIKHSHASPLGALGFAMAVIAAILFNGKEESLYERCFWSFQILLWLHLVLASGPSSVAQQFLARRHTRPGIPPKPSRTRDDVQSAAPE